MTCWYCKKRPAGKGDLTVKMRRTVSRTGGSLPGVLYAEKTTYEVKRVTIPRCDACAAFHNYRKKLRAIYQIIFGVLLSIPVSIALVKKGWNLVEMIPPLLFVILHVWAISIVLTRVHVFFKYPKQPRIRSPRKYGAVQSLQKAGWERY